MKSSQLEDIPLKHLIFICKRLLKSDFNYEEPYEDYEGSKYELERVMALFSLKPQQIDVEFISMFIKLNIEVLSSSDLDQGDVLGSIVYPQGNEYEIYYEMWGGATYTEKYKQEVFSYNRGWIKDATNWANEEGVFNYWEGDYLGHETDGWEPDNFKFGRIEKLNEEKIDSLEKTTLLEIRNLIDKKLSKL